MLNIAASFLCSPKGYARCCWFVIFPLTKKPSSLCSMMQGPIAIRHADMVLRYQLCTDWQLPARLGACYCVPPTGGFVTHQSGCDPRRGIILHMFDEEWTQEGTRPFARWHKHRALCHFSLRGFTHALRRSHVNLKTESIHT